jgi:formylglycine-generating enzyme required for sulfatase activity
VSGRENHPLNCVGWFQAEAFCTWSDQRLPIEWEWEWAARGRDEGRSYPWGEAATGCMFAVMWEDVEDVQGCGQNGTWGVGSKSPAVDSGDGLRDMAGNVTEWTGSRYDDMEANRVVRGGAWVSSKPDFFRTELRDYAFELAGGDTVGFRCVRTP